MDDEAKERSVIGQLVAEWRQSPRVLFLVDEVRQHDDDPNVRQIVSFVVLVTDTQRAASYADRASVARELLKRSSASAVFKGAQLYGSRRRKAHDGLRALVRNAVADCVDVLRFTTSSAVLKRLESNAPGGIRPVTEHGDGMAPIRGRELVPLMHMLKAAAVFRELGPVRVDVLLDRSAQLGLDPSQVGRSDDVNFILGPGTLNEQAGGAPTLLQCPAEFLLIAPAKRGPFRDIALLPDAVAYAMLQRNDLNDARVRLLAGEEFVVERGTGARVAAELGM